MQVSADAATCCLNMQPGEVLCYRAVSNAVGDKTENLGTLPVLMYLVTGYLNESGQIFRISNFFHLQLHCCDCLNSLCIPYIYYRSFAALTRGRQPLGRALLWTFSARSYRGKGPSRQ